MGSKAADAKYVLRSELDKFWKGGTRIIVLYHHPNRKDKDVSHDEQIANLAAQIKNRPAFSNTAVFPLRYRRGASRVYFVTVPQQDAEKWAKLSSASLLTRTKRAASEMVYTSEVQAQILS
ncbi:MAG TPA: hypothetical protein VJ325_02555 [Thiobacillus sp.]|nr:hypothetical protein [Thiobacillus sp.]